MELGCSTLPGTLSPKDEFAIRHTEFDRRSTQTYATNAPVLQNVVATLNVGCKLNLIDISERALNVEYNPRRFSAVIMRIRNPKSTALIFATGKLVITGAKDEQRSRDSARKQGIYRFTRILQKLGYKATFNEFKIQNLVASADVFFRISLERLHIQHSKYAQYDPEIFPGIIYRFMKSNAVVLIFATGKLVITGGRNISDINRAFNKLYPVLCTYKQE